MDQFTIFLPPKKPFPDIIVLRAEYAGYVDINSLGLQIKKLYI